MSIGLHMKHPIFLSDFNDTSVFSTDSPKNNQTSNSTNIRAVGAELFLADRQTDRHDEANSHCRKFANAPNESYVQTRGNSNPINP
jgi:cysteine synthase